MWIAAKICHTYLHFVHSYVISSRVWRILKQYFISVLLSVKRTVGTMGILLKHLSEVTMTSSFCPVSFLIKMDLSYIFGSQQDLHVE